MAETLVVVDAANLPRQKSDQKSDEKSEENLSILEVKPEIAQTLVVVDAVNLPDCLVKKSEAETRMVVDAVNLPDDAVNLPDDVVKTSLHYIYSKSLISNLRVSNLQGGQEEKNEHEEKRQNANPDNPESTAVHTAYANNTQERVEQTGNFATNGQKEEEIFHKQINPQLDQNCGGGAASGVADKLPVEKNNQKNEEKNKAEKRVDPWGVKKKWRESGRLDERFLRYVESQMSGDREMHPRRMAHSLILKHEKTMEGIELLEGYWSDMEEGIGVDEWRAANGEIFPWFLSLVIDACYHAKQGNTIEAATMEATKQLRNRNTAAALWKKFKHRMKGEGEKIERNKALGVTGYVPPSWMRDEEVELAEVEDVVQKITESTSLPAPKLKEAANIGLETAATSVNVAQSTRQPEKENKQVVGDFKGSNGNSAGEVNSSCERSARQVTGLSGLGEMARAVAVNVAVVESVESPATATEMEVNETASDGAGVDYSAAATPTPAVVREGHGVSQEQIEGMKRISEMVKALKMKKSVKKVNAEIVSEVEGQGVRELTYFERMNEWIKGKDIALVNEAMKWAMGQEDIEFEHDEEGRVIGIVQKRKERQVAQVC